MWYCVQSPNVSPLYVFNSYKNLQVNLELAYDGPFLFLKRFR